MIYKFKPDEARHLAWEFVRDMDPDYREKCMAKLGVVNMEDFLAFILGWWAAKSPLAETEEGEVFTEAMVALPVEESEHSIAKQIERGDLKVGRGVVGVFVVGPTEPPSAQLPEPETEVHCPDCKGTGVYEGFLESGDCATCKGSGRVEVTEPEALRSGGEVEGDSSWLTQTPAEIVDIMNTAALSKGRVRIVALDADDIRCSVEGTVVSMSVLIGPKTIYNILESSGLRWAFEGDRILSAKAV
jgi:hypothetical protein